MIWPAVMFAKRRTIKAKGFVNIPIISTGIIIGLSHNGNPGVQKMSFQYSLFPLNCVIINVRIANTKVSAMLPVTFAPNGGGTGINPKMLFKRIKKNTDNR